MSSISIANIDIDSSIVGVALVTVVVVVLRVVVLAMMSSLFAAVYGRVGDAPGVNLVVVLLPSVRVKVRKLEERKATA